MKLSKDAVRRVLGANAVIEGPIATSAAGGMVLDASPAPHGATRLPANWRNVLGRCAWFAKKYETLNDPRTCILVTSTKAMAGDHAAMVQLAFETDGGRMPMLLPTEVRWHEIPGTDGAQAWEYERGYALQTDSGLRVYCTRSTAELDPHPWWRHFEYFDPAYTTYEIVEDEIAEWIDVFERPPSDVVQFSLAHGAVMCREARDFESRWSYSVAALPAKLSAGRPSGEAIWIPSLCMLYALKAVVVESQGSVLVAFKGPQDPIYVTGQGDEVAIVVPVGPVSVRPHPRSLVAPKPPESSRSIRTTGRA